MKTLVSNSLEETAKIASDWLESARGLASTSGKAVVIGLSGHLGAGKTAFTKAVGKSLGISEEITSPTFVIMKIYETTDQTWKKLIHIDAYRLESKEELEILKLDELRSDLSNLIIIEWPENVGITTSELNQLIRFEIREGKFTIAM